MTYHDDIITIKLCRGELAVALGERGLMVKDWRKFAKMLNYELSAETENRDDGHTGSSGIGEYLIDRVTGGYLKDAGLIKKPDSGKHECWPFEEKWFDGGVS